MDLCLEFPSLSEIKNELNLLIFDAEFNYLDNKKLERNDLGHQGIDTKNCLIDFRS